MYNHRRISFSFFLFLFPIYTFQSTLHYAHPTVVTTAVTSTKEYVIYTVTNGTGGNTTNNALTYPLGRVAVTVNGDVVTSNNDNIKWVFETTDGGYYIYYKDGNTNRYLRDNSQNNNNNGSELATATSTTSSRIVWTYSDNHIQNVATSRYLRYNANNFSLDKRIANAAAITLAEVQVPEIMVHYVDESGTVLHNPVTMPAPSNTYGFTNPYDVVLDIGGYTYHNTFLTSQTGTQIIPELVVLNGNWTYVRYGLEGWTGDNTTPGSASNPEKYQPISTSTDIYVVYGDAYGSGSSGGGGGSGGEPQDMTPQAGKNLANNNDGTYTLSLSITGKGDTHTEANGANVIMVFDTSSSMTRNNDAQNSQGQTCNRLVAAKESAQSVATELLGMNTQDNPDLVELYLIDFDYYIYNNNTNQDAQGDPYNIWYTNAGTSTGNVQTDFNARINSLDVATGTNWEAALQEAYRVAKAKNDGDATYIIFITDGNPSARVGTQDEYSQKYTGEPTTSTSNINATSNYDYTYYNRNNNYLRATDDARKLVQEGYSFYSIGIYGNVDVLANLTNFAYNGRSTKADSGHYFPAKSTSALNEALSSIAETIKNTLALAGVSFEDGIATDVTTTTLSTSASGTVKGVTYRKTGGESASFTVTIQDDGTPMFSVGGATPVAGGTKEVNYTKLTENEDGTVTESAATAEVFYATVDGKEYQMAKASYDANGELKWDLSPLGTLEEGATYRISFIIWPDQDAYDLVADLNNGVSEKEWDTSLDTYENLIETAGYEVGGIEGFPHIVRYPGGAYAALTNTHQDVQYFIANTEEIEGGGTKTTYTVGPKVDLKTPSPAELTSTSSKITKKWNADMAKTQLISFLYDTYTGESLEKAITFKVYQDEEEYTTSTLGWTVDADHPDGYYKWVDETETIPFYPVVDGSQTNYEVGTVWQNDFAISTGMMLSTNRMDALGLNKANYTSVVYGGTTYYILEPGHDYKVDEPTLSYSFDFVNKTYHPMLIDGQLKNVFFEKEGDTITGISKVEDMADGIRVDNTLRGGINLKKVVQTADGEDIFDTDDEFTFKIEIDNEEEGLFSGDNTPWYAIDGFYYHDADWNLYSVPESDVNYDANPVELKLIDQDGNEYAATSSTFHESIGPADVTYTNLDGETVTIQLYGNAMEPNEAGTHAEAEISIAANTSTLRIANVPINTTYKIVEVQMTGYELDDITRLIVVDDNDENPMEESEGIDVANYTIEGEIVANRQNNITFINRPTDEAFYVYHSSDNTVEKVLFADSRVEKTLMNGEYTYTFNIVNETKTDFLYGGYYTKYNRTSTGFDATTLEYDTDNWSQDDGGTPYVGGLSNWSAKNAYTNSGQAMNPTSGITYYLKEVPEWFLQPYLYVIYDIIDKNNVKDMYLMTDVDDNNYNEIGLFATDIRTGDRIKLAVSFKIIDTINSKTDTIKADTIAKASGFDDVNAKGYVAVWNPGVASKDFTFTPYFITPDAITVEGTNVRSVSVGNGTYQDTFAAPGITFTNSSNAANYITPGNVSTRTTQ